MANIKTHLDNIKNALFGQEVRGSIHDGIDAINKEVESTTSRQVDLESTFDQLVINAGNSNAEIVDARVKADGTSYSKLGDRLDSVDSQLEHIVNIDLATYLINSDITQAFKNALLNIDNGKIFIPKGIYTISDVIEINKSVYLEFSPGTKIINPFTNKTTLLINSDNVTINGCVFEGNANRTDITYAITISDSINDVNVVNNTFKNFNGGVILISENSNINFNNNTFKDLIYPSDSSNTGGYGIVLQSANNCKITNNNFINCERHCIYLGRNPINRDVYGYNHIISNNTFIGINKDKYITGNEFLLKIMGNHNVSISGNVFDGGVGHLWFTSSGDTKKHCENISVIGNVFRNLKSGNYETSSVIGSASDTPLEGLTYVQNITISSNTIIDCDVLHAMKFDLITNSVISNNIIKGKTENGKTAKGIYVTRGLNNTLITSNNIIDVDRAIHLIGEGENKSVTINNNNINNVVFGLFLEKLTSLVIKNNDITSKQYQPIYLTSCVFEECDISNNKIKNGNNGITLNETSGEIYIYDNNFYGQTINLIENKTNVLIKRPTYCYGIRKNIEVYLDSKPITGAWSRGDRVILNNPNVGGYLGYICTNGGNPGVWKGFGLLES